MQRQIDSLSVRVDSARELLGSGTVEDLQARVDQYQAGLGLMRRLVPTENEVTTLIDQVSTRAQMRDVRVMELTPLPPELRVPFRVHRYRFRVVGEYDRLGEFLSDVASLSRIMVPYEIDLSEVTDFQVTGGDSTITYLQARFMLRTFAKSAVSELEGGDGA